MRTTNGLKRLNKELKRRTRVATLFPNTENCMCLIRTILAEQDKEWMTAKTCLVFDFGAEGRVLGIEMLDVSESTGNPRELAMELVGPSA